MDLVLSLQQVGDEQVDNIETPRGRHTGRRTTRSASCNCSRPCRYAAISAAAQSAHGVHRPAAHPRPATDRSAGGRSAASTATDVLPAHTTRTTRWATATAGALIEHHRHDGAQPPFLLLRLLPDTAAVLQQSQPHVPPGLLLVLKQHV